MTARVFLRLLPALLLVGFVAGCSTSSSAVSFYALEAMGETPQVSQIRRAGSGGCL